MPDLITSTNFNAFIVHKWTYGRHICWLAFCQRSLLSITIKWGRIYFLAVIRGLDQAKEVRLFVRLFVRL